LLETDVEAKCLEMMPSCCQQVNWGNCGIPCVNCAFLCVTDELEGQFWSLTLLPDETAQFTRFLSQVWRYTVKSLSLTECIERLNDVSQVYF
jgi:hypothetical protein